MKISRKKKGINKLPAGFWGMSKPVMGVVVVIFLIIAGVIFYLRASGGSGLDSTIESLKGQMQWMKCNNPSCGTTYEMDKGEYQQYLKDHPGEVMAYLGNPPLPCKKCGEQSLLPAIKCPKCGNVFFKGAMGKGEFADKCPKCSYSATEEKRKRKR